YVWQVHVQRYARGLQLARQRHGLGTALGDHGLETIFVRQFQQHSSVTGVVLDDKEGLVTRLDLAAIVLNGGFLRLRQFLRRWYIERGLAKIALARRRNQATRAKVFADGAHRDMRLRQVEGENAALPESA